MIKFVERTKEQYPALIMPGTTFVLETDYLRVASDNSPYGGGESGLNFYDGENYLFCACGKLYACPMSLGWHVHWGLDNALEEEYNKIAPKNPHMHDDVYQGICVDPRFIMACEMYTYLGPYYGFPDIIEEALNPLPSYEEAEKWLFDNNFATGDPKGEWRCVGRCTVYEKFDEINKGGDHYDPHYVNLPPKVEEAFREIRKRAREEEEAREKRMMEGMAREGK